MKEVTGEELIALAGVVSVKLAECMDLDAICSTLEFLGLLRHNLEIIKFRRIELERQRERRQHDEKKLHEKLHEKRPILEHI